MTLFERVALYAICLSIFLSIFIFSIRGLPQIYTPLNALARYYTEWQTRDWLVKESEHFRVKYLVPDAGIADLVLSTAEEQYRPATALLGVRDSRKTLILIYPDRYSLAKPFGWANDEEAMGVYWAGVIRIVSPRDWVQSKEAFEEIFKTQGPVVHEFAHLLVDRLAKGNYPRWLTEGIAQQVEKQVTGYELPGPEAGEVSAWYSLEEMDKGFDGLPDQSLAYRQSSIMVGRLLERAGWEGIRRLLELLGSGWSFEKALFSAAGTRPEELLPPALR
ncbi:MAG: hypothetical protein L5656_02450 [Thermanaeromonas sp.]|uniref:peptidase MA family metallohydrolase n=1 Tax=Thermanaeromonas sp. TaxID=2003697 RepID=UPI00243ADA10|nr:hypothetical protein [Thermanaeromonas sp.]MCG0277378.1 hypothetical protein [Thermanaeromonas sp.]